ncbi:lipoprotein [Rossellomorea aquimaris]|uniref:lipoprotein n=1 Tax=Rossellomorea aquimaris TaxID=189382 RepID=UPI001CFF1CA1|nr:lipoprotein [Rossellomorea aquimaris]
MKKITLLLSAVLFLSACSEKEEVVKEEPKQEVKKEEPKEEVKKEDPKEEVKKEEPKEEVKKEDPKEKTESKKMAERIKEKVEKESKESLEAALNAKVATDTSNYKPNYENTESMIDALILKRMSNFNNQLTQLALGGSMFSNDEMSTWFTDFAEADKEIDVYLDILDKVGATVLDISEIHYETLYVKELENYAWELQLSKTDKVGSKDIKTIWNFTVKPDELGNFRIHTLKISPKN